MSTAKQTHDHKEIKSWVENQGGVPAIVKGTDKKEGGVLRIHFPEHSDHNKNFEEIDWDTFFDEFDSNKLDFLYQETKADGEDSTFHKFIERDNNHIET
jgi:hypothetical protein